MHAYRNGLMLSLIVIIVNGVYIFIGNHLIDEKNRLVQRTQMIIEKTIPGLNFSQELVFNLTELRRIQLRETVFNEDFDRKHYDEKTSVIINKNKLLLEKYSTIVESQNERIALRKLRESWESYLNVSFDAVMLYQHGNKEAGKDALLNHAVAYLIAFEEQNALLLSINNEYISNFSHSLSLKENKSLSISYLLMVANFIFQGILLAALVRLSKLKSQAINDANIDPLTQLSNRRRLLSDWSQGKIPQDAIFIMGDIDHFKIVNDTYGHDAGDFILFEIAKILKRESRKNDVVIRMGGEEFAIVATNSTLQEAYAVAERIRKDIESTHFIYHADTTLHVTISFGLSQIMSSDPSLEEVVTRADKKLYQSKTNGRNRTSY